MLENLSLKTNNYKLSDKQLSFIKQEADSLSRKIPYNSQIKLVISLKDKKLSGNLIVSARKKTFYASETHVTLNLLVKSVFKKVCRQTNKWKKDRTHEEVTGVINLPLPYTHQKIKKTG